jgi:hypothetical protein
MVRHGAKAEMRGVRQGVQSGPLRSEVLLGRVQTEEPQEEEGEREMNFHTLTQTIERLNAAKDDDDKETVIDSLSAGDVSDLLAYLRWLAKRPRSAARMNAPAGMAVHHLDGNPHNSEVANLRFVVPRENRKATAPERGAA